MSLANALVAMASCCYVSLSIFLLTNSRERQEIFYLFGISCSSAIWAVGVFSFLTFSGPFSSIIDKSLYLSSSCIAAFFVLFSFKIFKNKELSFLENVSVFIPTAILWGLIFTDRVITLSHDLSKLIFHKGFFFFFVYILGYFFWGIALLIKRFLISESASAKNQLKYFISATLLVGFVDITFNLVLLPIFEYKFLWVGPLSGFIWVSILTYAITKHELIDIKVVITRASAFIVTAGLFLGGFWMLLYSYTYVISPHIGWTFVAAFSVFMVGTWLLFTRIQHFIQTHLEYKFLKNHYDIDEVIRDISNQLLISQDRKNVVDVIAHTLRETIQPHGMYYLLQETHKLKLPNGDFEEKNLYQLYSYGKEGATKEGLHFEGDHPFINSLAHQTQVESTPTPDRVHELETNGLPAKGGLIVPLHAYDTFHGAFIIGPKASEEDYTRIDINLFTTIMYQIMLVFERLKPIEKLKADYEKSLEIAKQASINKTFATMTKQLAHEIRNPMQGLSMHTENMLSKLQKPLNSELLQKNITDYIHIAQKVVQQVTRVTTSMMNFGHYKGSLKTAIHPKIPVRDSVDMIAHYLLTKQIVLHQNISDDLPLIMAQQYELNQVLINIMMNAAQAMDEGKDLTISAYTQHFTTPKGNWVEGVCFEITDTGKGMSPEEVSRIFEPFFTNKYEGIGLGMAVTFQIVTEHDGRLEIDSELGKGTTVKIFVPAS